MVGRALFASHVCLRPKVRTLIQHGPFNIKVAVDAIIDQANGDIMCDRNNLPKHPFFFLGLLKDRLAKLALRFNNPYALFGDADTLPDCDSPLVGFVTTRRGGFPILRD